MTAPAVNSSLRERLILRLRALMARTVVNGCTEEEELVAARMVAKMIGQLEGIAPSPAPARPDPHWAREERESQSYQVVLEKNTAEALLKAAVRELALNHINTIGPHRIRQRGEQVERVSIHELLEPHLGMMLATNGSRLSRDILRRTIDELVYDQALPPHLDMPLGR